MNIKSADTTELEKAMSFFTNQLGQLRFFQHIEKDIKTVLNSMDELNAELLERNDAKEKEQSPTTEVKTS